MKPCSILLWLALASLLYASPPATAQLPASISGAWYNPAQSGHGLSVELHSPSKAIVFWMVYDPDGNPVHLYIDASVQGQSLSGPAYLSRGMRFGSFDREEHQFLHWGEVTLKFLTCSEARLSYDASGPAGAGYGQGQLPLQRLVGVTGLQCEGSSENAGLYEGSLTRAMIWAEPAVAMLGSDGKFYMAVGKSDQPLTTDNLVAVGSHQWWGERNDPMHIDLLLARSSDAPINGWLPPPTERSAVVDLRELYQGPKTFLGDLMTSPVSSYSLRLYAREPADFERAITLANIFGEYRQSAGDPGTSSAYDLRFAVGDGLGANVQGLEFRGPDDQQPSCRIGGEVRPLTGKTVELSVDLQLSECGERSGHYRGRGWVSRFSTFGDALHLELIATRLDSQHALRFNLSR